MDVDSGDDDDDNENGDDDSNDRNGSDNDISMCGAVYGYFAECKHSCVRIRQCGCCYNATQMDTHKRTCSHARENRARILELMP